MRVIADHKHAFAVLILLGCGVSAAYGEPLDTFFGKNLIKAVEVLDVYKGSVRFDEVEVDGKLAYVEVTNSAEGGPSNDTTTDSAGHFSGYIGLELKVPDLKWSQYGHYWKLDFRQAMTPTRGIAKLTIQCLDENDELIETMILEEHLFQQHLLGVPGNKIQGIESLRVDHNFPSIVIPKADGSNWRRSVTKVRLGVYLSEWKGALRLYNIRILPFKIKAQDSKKWEQDLTDGFTIGANGQILVPSYHKEGDHYSPLMMDTGLKLLSTGGVKSQRYFAHWDKIEPIKGQFDFSDLDHHIGTLSYYGINVGLITIHSFPKWATDISEEDLPDELRARMKAHFWEPSFPPSNWADYEDFVTEIVTRYKDIVKDWEVWNEPNGHIFAGDSIQIYKQLLMRFYRIAKQIDPECTVICGRVGYWFPYLIEEGLADSMDAVASHPYYYPIINELRTVMVASGVHKPISITEFGYNGGGWPWRGPATYPNEQARIQAVRNLIPSKIANIALDKIIYWYTPIQANRQYGLVQYLGDRLEPAPVYYTLGELSKHLDPENMPIKVTVESAGSAIERGATAEITLSATNVSKEAREVRFWPVGFIEELGIKSLEQIREHDWSGKLEPGESYSTTVTVNPNDEAHGRYKVGLAVVTDINRNSLALEDLYIYDLALDAAATASGNSNEKLQALNDYKVPVWSGDQDTEFLIWNADAQGRSHWVQYHFDEAVTVSSSDVYWYDNSTPDYPIGSITYDTHATPRAWRLEYKSDGEWVPVEAASDYGSSKNAMNTVTFSPVTATEFRLIVEPKADRGTGVGEWRLGQEPPAGSVRINE